MRMILCFNISVVEEFEFSLLLVLNQRRVLRELVFNLQSAIVSVLLLHDIDRLVPWRFDLSSCLFTWIGFLLNQSLLNLQLRLSFDLLLPLDRTSLLLVDFKIS